MYADNPKETNKAQRKEKTHGIVIATFLEIQKMSLHIILNQSEILELWATTTATSTAQGLSKKYYHFHIFHIRIAFLALTHHISSLAKDTLPSRSIWRSNGKQHQQSLALQATGALSSLPAGLELSETAEPQQQRHQSWATVVQQAWSLWELV